MNCKVPEKCLGEITLIYYDNKIKIFATDKAMEI
jgi:hypothetical protein